MKEIGIDVDLMPVIDIDYNSENLILEIIYSSNPSEI
jgi:beta-glucosidase-like glycosyl hydrolase